MFKNIFRLSQIVPHVNHEQKRTFLTIINQGYEAYRTTFGRNLGKFSQFQYVSIIYSF